MSDIAKFVADNFRSLQPTDYFLLSVFAALLAAALFLGFRYFYAARFAAQNELLSLHAQRSVALAEQISMMTTEKAGLAAALTLARTAIEKNKRQGVDLTSAQDEMMLKGLNTLAGVVMTIQHRATILYQFLLARAELRLPSPARDAKAAADALNYRSEVLQAALHAALTDPTRKRVEDLLVLLQASETEESMTRARAEALRIGYELQRVTDARGA